MSDINPKHSSEMKQAIRDKASQRALALISGGRQMAGGMFEELIKGSDTKQVPEKLFMLRIAAVHILAMDAFNYEKNTGGKGNTFIDQLTVDIRNELKFLQAEEAAGHLKKVDASPEK